ncbi:MAG: tetratricopeptide repeat protein [Planctomycetia bacterium]|nr:tetratricopeptide repeat protein [Planctomycetia bacterium]
MSFEELARGLPEPLLAIVDRFDEAWQTVIDERNRGSRPDATPPPEIRDYLRGAPQANRPVVLKLLIEVDRERRAALGQHMGEEFYEQLVRELAPAPPAAPAVAQPGGAAADRNLLFGILALQMDFITRESLVQAMHAWVLQKHKPLGEILVEQGKMTAANRDVLEQLVDAHIRQHDGDPQRSLASLSSGSSLRDDLASLADPDLDASLASVGADVRPPGSDTTQTCQSTGIPSGGRFRIVRFHAEGGLGKVHVALDQELHREVALKEIKPEFAEHASNKSRFLLEAEVTGGLEHPNIVPVYGLGRFDDGRPFYVMRFIKGDSLKAAIAQFHRDDVPGRDPGERSLALRKLLRRLVDVCNAVAYAHGRGVLHRDLKPGNVMLGKYGETLLVDWGLAKPLAHGVHEPGESSEATLRPPAVEGLQPTSLGSTVGTPAYMSPEQAAGKWNELGPASDVYSLGATLYHLLTGAAAIDGQTGDEVLDKARRGDFPPPRARKSNVPRGLEAICLKAMALRPADRYASATALANDVEHWLADEPVSAWREPVTVRAGRWIRRHRTLATTVAAVLLLSAAGGVWLQRYWQQQRSDTERAVTLSLVRGEQLRHEASKSPAATSRQAREAIGVWKQAQGAMEAAEAALAVGMFDERLRERVRQFRHGIEAGRSQTEAELTRLLREEQLLGDFDEARMAVLTLVEGRLDYAGGAERYERAFSAYGLDLQPGKTKDLLSKIGSQKPAVREALIAALDNLANCTYAAVTARSALSVDELTELAQQADADPWRRQYREAIRHRNVAQLRALAREARQRKLPPVSLELVAWSLEALDRQAALDMLRFARAEHPTDFWISFRLGVWLWKGKDPAPIELEEAIGCYRAALALRPDAAVAHYNLGMALKAKGELDEAIREYRKAIELDSKYASAHNNLGNALDEKGALDEAIAEYRKAIELDPKLAVPHNNLGVALKAKGALDEAIAEYRTAIALDPKLASAHHNLGVALARKGELDEAICELRTAIELDPKFASAHYDLGVALDEQGALDEAIAEYRTAIALDSKYALAHNNLGNALDEKGALDEAIAEYRKAIELDPKLAFAHYNLGNALDEKGVLDEAIAEYRKTIEVDPKFAFAHGRLGVCLQKKGALDEAIAEFRKAIELDPKFAAAQSNLGVALHEKGELDEAIRELRTAIALDSKDALAHYNLGVALHHKSELNEAIAEYRKAIELDPKLARAHHNLGIALDEKGELDQAIAEYRKAIELDPKLAEPHNNLGLALRAKGALDEAIAEFRKAIELNPKLARAHHNLGIALHEKGELDEAIAEHRKALELEPKRVYGYVDLGVALREMAKFAEAKASFQQAVDQLPPGDPARQQCIESLRELDRLIALESKLADILSGKAQPADNNERLDSATACYYQRRYASCARFSHDAFAADPKLADNLHAGNRYTAACAAALAAAGQGVDAGNLAEDERMSLRQQALDWLRADLAQLAKTFEGGKPDDQKFVADSLRHWQTDRDLASVREPEQIQKLSAEERAAWEKFWEEAKLLWERAERPG